MVYSTPEAQDENSVNTTMIFTSIRWGAAVFCVLILDVNQGPLHIGII